MEDNILTLVHFDVCFALQKLEEQINDKQRRHILIRSNRELFDAGRLVKYLSEATVNKTFVLTDILQKSYRIIDLNNNAFVELEKLENENFEKIKFSTKVSGNGSFTILTPFECFTIEDKKILVSNNENGRKHFFEQGNFDRFASNDFAHRCATLINIITAAYPALTIDNKDKNKSVRNFKLLANLATTDCYSTLANHNFIKENTDKKDFKKIFDNKEIINKIVWTGSLPELARFVFLLHNDLEKDNNKAVCKKKTNIYIIATNCFCHNGDKIDAAKLKNNNRDLKDKVRLGFLLKAISHLAKPIPATQK